MPSSTGLIVEGQVGRDGFIMPKPDLKIAEPREPYNTKEDLLELASAYKEAKETGERNLWELADLAHEAAEKYSLKEFAKATGENYNQLTNLSYIAGRYDKITRAGNLTFRHHMVAAKSDSRLEWLKKAEDNAWSAERLRREISPPKPKPEPVKPEPVIPSEPNPVAQIAPLIPKEQSRTLTEMVGALNWYLVNDKRSLELAASNALNFLCLILGEERRIVFNEITGEYEIQ